MASSADVAIEGCTGMDKGHLACCIAKQACKMCCSTRYELLVIDEWLDEDVDDKDIGFLFEPIKRRCAAKLTVLRTQYAPAG